MQTTNEPRSSYKVALYAAAAIVLTIMILAMARCSYMDNTADRNDVAQAVAAITPNCRPVANMRIRTALINGGHPLSRRQLTQLTSHLRDCDKIDAQMQGLTDGMGAQ